MFKFAFALLSLFVLTIPINAQVTDRKFEVGGFFTSITLDDFKDRVSPGFATGDSTVNGIGGRLTYNLNETFAIDGEATFFPSAHLGNDEIGQNIDSNDGALGWIKLHYASEVQREIRLVGHTANRFGEFTSRGSCSPTSFGSGEHFGSVSGSNSWTFGSPVILDGGFKSNFQVSLGFAWRF